MNKKSHWRQVSRWTAGRLIRSHQNAKLIFWTKLARKGLLLKKSEYYHQVLHIWNSLATIFLLKLLILNFWAILTQKGYFQPKKIQNKNHHWILHIRVSPGYKFKPQQIIPIFWNKFSKKGYFWSKTGKMNITIEFCIFKLD